MIEFATIELGI